MPVPVRRTQSKGLGGPLPPPHHSTTRAPGDSVLCKAHLGQSLLPARASTGAGGVNFPQTDREMGSGGLRLTQGPRE